MSYDDASVTVRGRQTRLLRGGSGTPLLYLHDTFSVNDLWLPLHDDLAVHYDVILPIHPGCEGSQATDIESMEDMVFHVLDLCEVLQIERPVVVGASLGGWVAAELAVRYADTLRALVLLDALGIRVPEASSTDVLRLDAAQARACLFAKPDTPLAQRVLPDVPQPEGLAVVLQARQTLARFAWQFPDNPRLARYLYRVRLPTLIIWGEQDGFVPLPYGRAYQAAIDNSALAVLPQCGHLPHIEQPEACGRAIIDFLTRL